MAIFFRKLFLFILVFIIVAGGIITVSSLYMNSIRFKIDGSKNILVIGDSHTECAIDDSTFRRAANYSKSATSFVYSYAALRKLIADNPQIDTVLLSFHSGSLWYEREKGWIFNESEIAKQVPAFLPYFNIKDMALFMFEPQFYKSALESPRTAYNYYRRKKKEDIQDWKDQNIGNFRDLSWSNFSKDTAATKPIENFESRDSISRVTLSYIRKISEFCKKRNITLILFNAPVYEWKKYANYLEFEENRQKFFKDLLFVNYAEFPIADSCRFDIWHLNGIGARQFSLYLDSNLIKDIKIQNH